MRFHLYEVSRVGKSTERESMWVVVRDWGEGGMSSNCLTGTGFIVRDGNVFELDRGGGYNNTVNVLNPTQLFILKWLILYCMNFTVIF